MEAAGGLTRKSGHFGNLPDHYIRLPTFLFLCRDPAKRIRSTEMFDANAVGTFAIPSRVDNKHLGAAS
jgi:hypothetical protein